MELTEQQVRQKFVKSVKSICDYWINESRTPTVQEKVEGAAFSILAMLDGCSMGMPGFIVAPSTDPGDKQYLIDNGEDYFPQNHESKVNCDIGGGLHDSFSALMSK